MCHGMMSSHVGLENQATPVIQRKSLTDQTTIQSSINESMGQVPNNDTQSGMDIRVADGNSTKTSQQPIPPAIVNTTNNAQQINQADPILERHLNAVAEATATRLKEADVKIQAIQQENQNMTQTANTLAKSLQSALAEMERTHKQHERLIQKNDDTVANLIQHSQALWNRNKLVGEGQLKHQQVLEQSAQQQQVLSQQTQVLWTEQNESRGHLATADSQVTQLQQELAQMKETTGKEQKRPTVQKRNLDQAGHIKGKRPLPAWKSLLGNESEERAEPYDSGTMGRIFGPILCKCGLYESGGLELGSLLWISESSFAEHRKESVPW